MKDYTTVDARHIQSKNIELVKQISDLCEVGINKSFIFSKYSIPSKLFITRSQFEQFALLQKEPAGKPTGREIFKTRKGYLMEIKVENDD